MDIGKRLKRFDEETWYIINDPDLSEQERIHLEKWILLRYIYEIELVNLLNDFHSQTKRKKLELKDPYTTNYEKIVKHKRKILELMFSNDSCIL